MSSVTKRFETPTEWNLDFTKQTYFADLVALFPISDYENFPSISELNQLAMEHGQPDHQFVEDEISQTLNSDNLYYEQFIYHKHMVPTRKDNWHDLFNALIWILFPKAKALLNQIHIEEINQFGLNPRTPTRNRVTHFDECGGLLVYESSQHLKALQQHQWQEAFADKRQLWGSSTKYFVFGHANYEMLTAPYVGLTGKYLPLQVQPGFWEMSLRQQYQWLDTRLVDEIKKGHPFVIKGKLKPLPLLGIPGWWAKNEETEFYRNTEYFRPLNKK